jgi:hypothetical protein
MHEDVLAAIIRLNEAEASLATSRFPYSWEPFR